MTSSQSRFEAVSRRAFVTRSLALGALVAIPGLACSSSSSDKSTFTTPTTDGTATTATTAGSTTAAGTDATAATTAGTPASGGATFPASGQVTIDFTFAASAGGQVHNPYIAVWIENAQGELLKTVSLWYQQRDSKYLNELQRWTSVESALQTAGGSDQYDTVSGGTRVAGAYTVMWDGTDSTGARVALGDYFVCIEAAREKGPYELVRGPVTIGDAASTTKLTDNGELSAASVAVVV